MPDVFFYNSLSRKREKFEPIEPGKVRLYTCGPTVYYYPQIGNWRTFVFEDVLRRTLKANGFGGIPARVLLIAHGLRNIQV